MISTLFLIFVIIVFLIIFRTSYKTIQNIAILFLIVVLILVAGLRPNNVTNDYSIYLFYWYDKSIEGIVEMSFVHIKYILKNVLNLSPVYLFLVYAILGVSSKIYAIRLLSTNIFLCILIYFCHFYILHELTQIRVGVATGFFLIGVYYLEKRNLWKFLFAIGLATFFHYSAFVAFPLWFVYNNENKLKYYLLLVPLGYIIYYLGGSLIVNIPIPYIQQKIRIYELLTEQNSNKEGELNLFSAIYLFRIVIFFILYFFRQKIVVHQKYIYLLLKIYAISLFSFTALATIPSFSFRIQQLFGVVEILLISSIVYIFNNKYFGNLSVIIIALIFLLINVYINKLVFY